MRGTNLPDFEKSSICAGARVKIKRLLRSQFGWHLIKVDRQGKDTTAPERAGILKRYQQEICSRRLTRLSVSPRSENTPFRKERFPVPAGPVLCSKSRMVAQRRNSARMSVGTAGHRRHSRETGNQKTAGFLGFPFSRE